MTSTVINEYQERNLEAMFLPNILPVNLLQKCYNSDVPSFLLHVLFGLFCKENGLYSLSMNSICLYPFDVLPLFFFFSTALLFDTAQCSRNISYSPVV